MPLALHDVDPFDLPDWLGTTEVTWYSDGAVAGAFRVPGWFAGARDADHWYGELSCELIAIDLAFPEPVATEDTRRRAHQAWQQGEVLVQGLDESGIVLAVPGSSFTADLALDALSRLARAVGADAARWAVHLELGRERA